jgi:hypothetical protein
VNTATKITELPALTATIQAIEKDNFSMPPEHQQKAAQLFTYKDQESGESLFLRKLVLGIPAQASRKNLSLKVLET